jgi:hypothetical protein
MYRKITLDKLTEKEKDSYRKFCGDNLVPEANIYYSTYNTGGIGFHIIVSTDKPKIINSYNCNFGNSIDITDYDVRINEY